MFTKNLRFFFILRKEIRKCLFKYNEYFLLQFDLALDESNKKSVNCCCYYKLSYEKELQKRDSRIQVQLIQDTNQEMQFRNSIECHLR